MKVRLAPKSVTEHRPFLEFWSLSPMKISSYTLVVTDMPRHRNIATELIEATFIDVTQQTHNSINSIISLVAILHLIHNHWVRITNCPNVK